MLYKEFDEFLVEHSGENMFIKKFVNEYEAGIDRATMYDAGYVYKYDNGDYILTSYTLGAEQTFSIGMPVYDAEQNLMGYLGIGLFNLMNNYTESRSPDYYWKICLPTEYCKYGKQVFTYWQTKKKDNKQ